MSTLICKTIDTIVSDVWFDSNMVYVRLLDGREIGTSLEWFPKLRDATHEQRTKWHLIGKGIDIHWECVDEDISVESLLIR